MFWRLAIALLLCTINTFAMGQGLDACCRYPFVHNYSPADYGASNTNWSIAQDSEGRILAANNSGLLIFNGEVWKKLYPFGESQSVRIRSLLADEGKIYLGAYREFGYVDSDSSGDIQYHSLSGEIPDLIGKEDEIWHIHKFGSKVFFLYFNCCYIHDVVTGFTVRANVTSTVCFDFNGAFYLSSQAGQIYRWDEAKQSFSMPLPTPGGMFILNMFSKDGKVYGVTSAAGVIEISEDGSSFRRIDRLGADYPTVNRCVICKDETIILGTIGDGVLAIDIDGNLKWRLGKETGLQNNDVMSLAEDRDGNIWVALDKGLSVIRKNGPYFIPTLEGRVGKVTALLKAKDGRILVGSNNGLYRLTFDKQPEYTVISGVKNQIWSISEDDGDIFVGGNTGTSILEKDNSLKQVSDVGGGTKVLRLRNRNLIQASFAPVKSLERQNGRWTSEIYVNDFYVPAAKILEDHLENLWVEHMYQGLYRINKTPGKDSVTYYPSLDPESRAEKIRISRLGGRLVFSNEDRFYIYDDIEDRIVPFSSLNDKLKGRYGIRMVSNSTDGKLWIAFKDGKISRITNEGKGIALTDVVDADGLGIRLLETDPDIINLDPNSYLIPIEGGFLELDGKKGCLRNRSGHLGIESIRITEGKRRGGNNDTSKRMATDCGKLTLKNRSSIEIHLFKSFCEYNNSAKVTYILKGYDDSEVTYKEGLDANYSNLPRGGYEFIATLKDSFGTQLDSVRINMTVRPSFWGSWMAMILYAVLAGLIAFGAYSYIKFLLKRQKRRMEETMEKEMIALKNKQLEESLLLKSDDLAKYSLIEAQRNKVLDQIRDKINSIYIKDPQEMKKSDYREIMRIIEDGGMSSDAWGTFYNNFDLVHDSFFTNLSGRYPSLTQSDLRYCAYLRLNMTTKEIAKATGVTVKGVEAAKGRLRKKMGIPQEISIGTFLLNQSTP